MRQIDGQRFLSVQLPRTADQDQGEVGVDSPVVRRVGVGQRTPRDFAAEPGVIQLRPQSAQARFDVPQAFAEGKLRESQTQELVAAREAGAAPIAAIVVDASVELAPRQEVYELRKHEWSVESFNGKLRDELLNREIVDTLLEAKVLIERWRRAYNTVRPHSSLGYQPPAPEANRAGQVALPTLT